MIKTFLIYGANGFVGRHIARVALERGLAPVLAGRDEKEIRHLAAELGLESRVFALSDRVAMDEALERVDVVLHCAGPYLDTYEAMVKGCLRNGSHYLDLTGEIPVYQGISSYGDEASEKGVMLLPGAGFDVVATDCLAVHLKQRLPSAKKLTLAFHARGPAGLPPGTVKSMLGMIPFGDKVRKDGRLVPALDQEKSRLIDFGQGPKEVSLLSWGDIFMAYHSTGIPNIADYAVLPGVFRRFRPLVRYVQPLFKLGSVRGALRRFIPSGSTAGQRSASATHVWGEVIDEAGQRAVSRLHGPEAGVDWTTICALDVVERVLAGQFEPGFQTPGSLYGPALTLEAEEVTWEDVV